ncbi:MAG: antitoxin family protein [Kouleothrix sp.]|nr:antitoxin family protein [Kouleothrix sp.]
MSQTITAVYENGVLRPLTPLALPEHARVELDVRPIAAPLEAAAQRERVREALAAAGVLASTGQDTNAPEPLRPHERMALAQALAEAGVPPLSTSILEEREGR